MLTDGTKDNSYVVVFGLRVHRAIVMLIGCCFVQSVTGAMVFACFGNFIVPICDELGCGRGEIAVFQTTYFLAMIPAFPIAAKCLERFGIRVVMSLSLVGLAASVGLMAVYTSPWQWVISGVMSGVFSSSLFHIPPVTLVNNWFNRHVGIAMGLSTAVGALFAVAFSPVLAGLISSLGWRGACLVEVAIMLVAGLPWCAFVFVDKPSDMGAAALGGDGAPGCEDDGGPGADARLSPKVARVALLSLPFAMLFVFGGLATFVGKGYDPHMSAYAQSMGFDAAFGALMISALNLGSFLEKLVMGWVNDRFGIRLGAGIEIALVAIGMVGLVASGDPLVLLVAAFLFGVQDSLTGVSLPLLVRDVFGRTGYGTIYAWTRVGGGVFGAFATMFVGLFYDFTGSYVGAFLVGVGMCALAGACVALAYRGKGDLRDRLKTAWREEQQVHD